LAVSLISIAFGAGHLMDKNVLVRRPDTLENLACSDVICTDKTGTLTLGEMTVRKVYANREMIDVSGHGYEPFGNFTDSGNRKKNIRGIFQLFCCSILCNNSILKKDETGWFVEGDPTEGALLVLAKKGGIEKEQLELEMPRIKENPFDAEKKLMSTVHGFGKKELVFVKGAPEDLLERCSRININGSIIKLSYKEKNKVMENNASMGKKGLRVLGFAYKKRGKKEDEENLIFLGLVGMLDPPRRELISSIEKCKEAGICVKMITKDSRETAIAVAKELGIGDHAITGEELESMEGGVNDAVEAFNVYARVFPAQKIELARVLKKTGRTVAMLGDNVGETNALEFSDVGIAKGKNGTDASRKASDVIISDDSFDSIVNAIEGGRGTYDNIKKSATYIFACITGISLTVLIGMFIALFFSKDFPLLIFEPVHMILLFIFFGIVLYPGLCSQRPFSYVLQEKPRKKSESLIEKSNIFDIALAGIAICVGTLFAFKIGLESSVYHASTMAFATLVCFFVFCLLNFRNLKQSIFSEFFKGTKVFFLVVASLALLSVLIYFPGFSQNLFFIPLEFADWMIALSVSFSVFVLMEIKKFILKIFVKEVPFQRKAAAE
ncbi:MAG: cation-translocating P-type ATPase, partial [Nanoarchaeota archaeon]